MSGVFGVVDPRRRVEASALMDEMAACLSHREWYVAERFVSPERNFALGRIGIGIFNPGPQPVWNASRTVALVMAGEIYKVDGADSPDGLTAPEQVALRLYEAKGAEFASHLNGAFVIAVWDQPGQRIVIANDRFGLYPLFYAFHDGRLMFAPEMKGILCDRSFPRRLDLTALAEYMRFQHLLGSRTFFEDVLLLPNASTLTFSLATGQLAVARYWDFDKVPDIRHRISFEDAVVEVGALLRQAVEQRSAAGHRRIGVYLSGGMDSRIIVGLIQREQLPKVHTITFGHKDCRDVAYARQVARRLSTQHHWFELADGRWVINCIDEHLELTEGFHSWIHSHGLSTLASARDLIGVNLCGLGGGLVMAGSDVDPVLYGAPDKIAWSSLLFYRFNQKNTWPSITEAEEKLLYAPEFFSSIRDRAFQSFQEEINRTDHYDPRRRTEYFLWLHSDRRLYQTYTVFYNAYLAMRYPFYAYELFDAIYSLPLEYRARYRLYRAVMQREVPHLSMIPYDKDDLLPTSNQLLRATHHFLRKGQIMLHRLIRPTHKGKATLYADYENYLRGELREWAESILFDERTLARGIFRPEALRSLMDRHLSGREEWTIGKIAPIITYEMMLRRLYD